MEEEKIAEEKSKVVVSETNGDTFQWEILTSTTEIILLCLPRLKKKRMVKNLCLDSDENGDNYGEDCDQQCD